MNRSKKVVSCDVPSFAQVWLHLLYYHTLRQSLRSWSGFIFAKIWYGVQDIFRFQINSYPKFDTEFVRFVGHILCKCAAGLVGNNCSSTVIFSSGLLQTIQFSTNLSQTAEIKANLFV